MSLIDWHRRLEAHFGELRAARTTTRGPDAPVFALEHGLSEAEIATLKREIRAADARPTPDNSLAWIVYATELGYDYTGDEYWQTFDEVTPRWPLHGHPHWLRERFEWFANSFGGARPSGAWARHFRIICWPITHAILPNDLQRQLARVLYDIRYQFSAQLFKEPLELGQRIAAASWNARSRFQNLSQNPLLLGQIATALLLQGELGSEGLLLPETLARIGRDLDKERREREWLRSARRYAHDRARFQGIENVGTKGTSARAHIMSARETVAELGIEPRLVLRPTDSTRLRWSVHLDIPDLSHLLLKFPGAATTLTQSRSRVAGSLTGWLARGRVLTGTQVQLSRWPRSDEPLLEFERPAPEISYLLRTECLLRPGDSWLFRVASDGLAYELRSHNVRPGHEYVLVTLQPPSTSSSWKSVTLECEGVHGVRINVPSAVSQAQSGQLLALGLAHARTLTVWPAGISPVLWDGEGRSEWLVDDEPCVGVKSDYECGSLRMRVVDALGVECVIPRLAAGIPTFVSMPTLPAGTYCLSIRGIVDPSVIGELEFSIRAPRPWASATAAKGPLLFDVDPAAPTLEAVWDGDVSITLNGPIGRRVQVTVKLFQKEAELPIASKTLPPLELPVTPKHWREHFVRHGRASAEFQQRYDSANVGEITFAAEDLGVFSLRCERELVSLRWVFKRDDTLRLIDDSGGEGGPEVFRYSFEQPDKRDALPLATQEVLRGFSTDADGGLYVGVNSGLTRAIIVPPHGRLSLADLRTMPRVDFAGGRSAARLRNLVDVTILWASARLTGNPLSASRRRDVLRRLCRHLFCVLGGDTWDRAESQYERSSSIAVLHQAVRTRGEEARLIQAVAQDLAAFEAATSEQRVARLTGAFVRALRLSVPMGPETRGPKGLVLRKPDKANPEHPEHLTRFALQLASDPATLANRRTQDVTDHLRRLQITPAIARTARFLVLAVDHASASTPQGAPYAGWNWQERA